jgi:hypothetical protein
MKIACFDEPRTRGVVIGNEVAGRPLSYTENSFKCDKCGGWFDARDLGWVEDHDEPLPHPGARSGAVGRATWGSAVP